MLAHLNVRGLCIWSWWMVPYIYKSVGFVLNKYINKRLLNDIFLDLLLLMHSDKFANGKILWAEESIEKLQNNEWHNVISYNSSKNSWILREIFR